VPIPKLEDDNDGKATTKCLKNVRRIASRISGNAPRSLGLHPAVYFYSATGRYQPNTFIATASLIQQLEDHDKFADFTRKRARFEDFILSHRYFVNQITASFGGGRKGLSPLVGLYNLVLDSIGEGLNDNLIVDKIIANDRFKALREKGGARGIAANEFNSETKSAAFLRDALGSAVRCKICGARIHKKGITIDHKDRKQDGGLGSLDNAQLAHPYCNTGFKESQHAKKKKGTSEP
jgi:hypothetical protein